MSIRDQIVLLKSLSVVDAVILALQTDLVRARAGIDEKATLQQGLVAKIGRLEQGIHAMEVTRNELHTEMRQTSTLLDRSREKMMRCRNEREANAVQRELEELRRVFREREHETEKLGGLIDVARVDLEASVAERDEITSQIDATAGAATSKVRALELLLAAESEKRTELLIGADRILIRKYDVVRTRRGTGLAIAADYRCSACNISLPPMLFQRISQAAELYPCPSCQRILHYVQPEAAVVQENIAAGEPADDAESSTL